MPVHFTINLTLLFIFDGPADEVVYQGQLSPSTKGIIEKGRKRKEGSNGKREIPAQKKCLQTAVGISHASLIAIHP